MKKSILILSILLFTLSAKPQLMGEWSLPIALTDTLSNNANPVVAVYPDDDAELYMFFEKGEAPFRQIWWKKISEPMSEEQIFIDAWPEVDYRNPQIFQNSFLLFESNVFGNYNLFGVKFDENGLAGGIFQLTNTEYDESSFFIINGYYSNTCCWDSEDNVFIAELQQSQDTLTLEDIVLIDSGDCFDPVCQNNYIAWRKVENNESHIYYSQKNWSTSQWSEPEAIVDTGNNINHSLSIVAISEIDEGYNLCWQTNNKIYFSNLNGSYLYSPNIPGVENYYEPSAYNYMFLTDNFPGFYSFVGETDSARDIYIMDDYGSSNVLKITNDLQLNKNPRLYTGRNVYGYSQYEIVNIWQTEINGYDVLYSSYAVYNVVIGGIDENEQSRLNVYPNPFTETLNIEFFPKGSEMINLEIYTLNGERVFSREIQGQTNTLQSISWNPKSDWKSLSQGVYFVKLTQGESITVKKVIYSE